MLRFKLFGVDIRIDFWFVAIVTFFLLTDRTGISILALAVCFLHELGHLIAFLAVGRTPRALIFELTGIRLIKPEHPLSPGREAVVLAAGSGANFLWYAFLSSTLSSLSGWSIFATAHLLVGIFNLLPLSALDGGKLLELFSLRFFPPERTGRYIDAFDFFTTAGLLLFSAALFFSGNRSLTLGIFSGGLSISACSRLQKWLGEHRKAKMRRNHK